MPKGQKYTVTTYVPPSVKRRLESDAKNSNRSVAAQVLTIIEKHYSAQSAEFQPPTQPAPVSA